MMQPIRNLASAVLLESAKEYCERGKTEEEKKTIIKELNSPWMDFLTSGMSKDVARELLKNEKIIRIRLRNNKELN